MRLLKMPTGVNSCLLYSAAMLLHIEPRELIDEIGHDGSEVWWAGLRAPHNERSHHMQEIIDCFLRRGHGLTPVEILPCSVPAGHPELQKMLFRHSNTAHQRFERLVTGAPGILIGMASTGVGHAAAWNGTEVYDPNGSTYGLELFQIRECWLLI